MVLHQQLLQERLQTWSREMETFHLPRWQELPPLELYMDQVLLLLKQYLEPLLRQQGDKAITASIVNNYVRLKIMPPPVKKKYARTHLAYLIMICTLKQSLSIASIQELLPQEANEEEVQRLYDDFVTRFHSVSGTMVQFARSPELSDNDAPAATAAIAAALTKALTEHLLLPEEQ